MLVDRIIKKRHHDDHERLKQHGSHMGYRKIWTDAESNCEHHAERDIHAIYAINGWGKK